jgi:hypothetical protein
MKEKTENASDILERVSAEVAAVTEKPLDMKARSEKLAAELKTAKPVKTKKVKTETAKITPTTAPEVKERPQLIEFGKRAKIVEKPEAEQTAYEKRYYMRDYHQDTVNPDTVTHLTSHTAGMIRERLLPLLQEMYAKREPKNAEFTCRDIIDALSICGPAQSDIVRAVFRELARAKKVEEIPHPNGRRTTFSYVLKELVPPTVAQPVN